MDGTTLVVLGGILVLAVVAALVMLRRSWGNFPGDASRSVAQHDPRTSFDEPDISMANHRSAATPAASGGLVLITNAHIRRAAEQALRRNDAAARYFVREGEQVYFNADAITDPDERRTAYTVIQRLGADEQIDMQDVWQVLQTLRR